MIPDGEVDLHILQQRDRYLTSVHETGADKPVCEEPKTPFPYDECGWGCIDDTSGKLLNNTHLPRRQELRNYRSFVNLVSGKLSPHHDEVVFGTRQVDINKGEENKPFYRSRLVVQEYKHRAEWSFSQGLHHSRLCKVC